MFEYLIIDSHDLIILYSKTFTLEYTGEVDANH
jgi:hypothetical protein